MNFNDRLIQGYDLAKKIPDLHGHAKIDFLRDGKIVHRVEHDNTITPWIANAIGKGNFHDQIAPSKIMPIKQWFEGCLLTDGVNDPELSMLAGDVNVTAQASNDAYSGDNQKRGSYNATESGIIENGFRFVWDWATNQGNGSIASVCLTRAQIARTALETSRMPDESEMIFEQIAVGNGINSLLERNSVVDIPNERGYYVTYNNGVVTVYVRRVSSVLHIDDLSYLNATELSSHEININTLPNYTTERSSVSLRGDILYFIYVNGGTLYENRINITDWSVTSVIHTYQGVNFYSSSLGNVTNDVYPIIDGYVYAVCNNGQKIAKCNLSNDADVTLYDNPLYQLLGYNSNVGVTFNSQSVILPNGDWYKTSRAYRGNYIIYCHNGIFYAAHGGGNWGEGQTESSFTSLGHGTVVRGSNNTWLWATFPYVSTVNNLDSAVTKTADLTMKLTYEITEV